MIIYLLLTLLLLLCVSVYDIQGYQKHKSTMINIIMICFVLVSGLAYRLGGDGIEYLNQYKIYGTIWDIDSHYFDKYEKMPGWVLLSTLCKSVTDSYWFFKLTHAAIVNYAYVKTIRRNTNYVFTGLFLYFILIYFNQNFQTLRESIAIAMFLGALPSFYNKEWLKYYFFVFLAISFHDGAAFLLLFPIMRIFGLNKYSILLYITIILALLYYSSDLINILLATQFEENFQDRLDYYLIYNEVGSQYAFTAWLNTLLNIVLPILIIYYYWKKKIEIKYLYPALLSILTYTVSLIIPIAYRFTNYVLIFNYLLIIEFVFIKLKERIILKGLKVFWSFALIFTFVLFKGRFYFTSYGDTKIPQYVQYYPYASVLEKSIDAERERLYRIMD